MFYNAHLMEIPRCPTSLESTAESRRPKKSPAFEAYPFLGNESVTRGFGDKKRTLKRMFHPPQTETRQAS